jgi:hypothetical protein
MSNAEFVNQTNKRYMAKNEVVKLFVSGADSGDFSPNISETFDS